MAWYWWIPVVSKPIQSWGVGQVGRRLVLCEFWTSATYVPRALVTLIFTSRSPLETPGLLLSFLDIPRICGGMCVFFSSATVSIYPKRLIVNWVLIKVSEGVGKSTIVTSLIKEAFVQHVRMSLWYRNYHETDQTLGYRSSISFRRSPFLQKLRRRMLQHI